MNLDTEVSRLLDLMPASGRMLGKIISKPQQRTVIEAPLPKPWGQATRPIYINFDLWGNLTRPQRDLLLLANVTQVLAAKWLKPNVYQGITAVALGGFGVELSQGDAVRIVVAGSLVAIAIAQIRRSNLSAQRHLETDEKAIKIAQRRGYSEVEAALALLGALETTANLEGRNLTFIELLRCQNLKSIGNLSTLGIPEDIRKQS